jgi:hypothetical protein
MHYNQNAAMLDMPQRGPTVPGNAIYKCQRCGREDAMAVPSLESSIEKTLQGAPALPFYTYHDCADGGLGVCQLVGGVYPKAGEVAGPAQRGPRAMKLTTFPVPEVPVPEPVVVTPAIAALAEAVSAVPAEDAQPLTSSVPAPDSVPRKRQSAINRLASTR